MEQQLSNLVERLKKTFGDRLLSAVLYGSGAVGDWNEKASDLNVLCVLERITTRELGESEPLPRSRIVRRRLRMLLEIGDRPGWAGPWRFARGRARPDHAIADRDRGDEDRNDGGDAAAPDADSHCPLPAADLSGNSNSLD